MSHQRADSGWSDAFQDRAEGTVTLTPPGGAARRRAPLEAARVEATTPTPLTASIVLRSDLVPLSASEAPRAADLAIIERLPGMPTPAPATYATAEAASAIALLAASVGAVAIMFPILPGSIDAASGVAIAAFAVATVVDRRVLSSARPLDVIAAAIALSFMGLTLSIATGVAGALFPLSALYLAAGSLVAGMSCVGAWNERRPLLMRVIGGSMFLLGLHVMQGS